MGAADDDLFADRKVTYHHDYYSKVKLRVPMYRGAVGHFFNNYSDVRFLKRTNVRRGTITLTFWLNPNSGGPIIPF